MSNGSVYLEHMVFGAPDLNTLESVVFDKNIVFNGTLREAQVTPHDAVIQYFANNINPSGLLSLPTALGKTVIALSLISHLKQKTCILIHKSQLLSQWKNEIEQFLPNAKIGIIQQTKKEFSADCDIYLVMIQTLLNVDVIENNLFGLTIVDECHHISSETFSKVLYKVNAKYLLGLSATPERKDGLTNVIHWHLGPIIHSVKPNRVGQNTTEVGVYRYSDPDYILNPKKYADMVTYITEYKTRNEYILTILERVITQDTDNLRRILILTERKQHAMLLYKKLELLLLENKTIGLMLGGMKKEILENQMTKHIIISTYNLLSEGISIAGLNTICFASPKRDVVQALGRIYRKIHDNVQPMVIDISDDKLRGQERSRLATYKTELNGNLNVTIFDEDLNIVKCIKKTNN